MLDHREDLQEDSNKDIQLQSKMVSVNRGPERCQMIPKGSFGFQQSERKSPRKSFTSGQLQFQVRSHQRCPWGLGAIPQAQELPLGPGSCPWGPGATPEAREPSLNAALSWGWAEAVTSVLKSKLEVSIHFLRLL